MVDAERLHIYDRYPISNSSVRRLGEALARGGPLSDTERDWYRSFTQDTSLRTSATIVVVRALLQRPYMQTLMPRVAASTVGGRPKTRLTLVEKLRRTPRIKLPAIHDVAGVRAVGSFSLFEQEQAARILASDFDGAVNVSRPTEIKNRIESPSHGYRALHLIVYPEGRPVEVQIRTDLQHRWAEIMEKICDKWGREPRYGEPVNYPDDQERDRRQSIIDQLILISESIADFELASQTSGLAHVHPPMEDMAAAGIDVGPIKRAQEIARDVEPQIEARKQNLLRALAQFEVDADPQLDV